MDKHKEYNFARESMSALKILAAMLLGAVLTAGGIALFQQQTQIDDLSGEVSILELQTGSLQNQTDKIGERLNDTVKTTNQNFRVVRKRENTLAEVMGALIESLTQPDDPSKYQRNGL